MLSKVQFIETIKVLQEQHDKDFQHHKDLCGLYGVDNLPMYDNSVLTNHLIKQLQNKFPKSADGDCDIERFIYLYDFGRISMANIKDSSDLWDSLMLSKKIY